MSSFSAQNRSVERVGYIVGALLIASGLIHLGILVITGDSWSGPVSFRKPMTFGVSFGVTLVTIVWIASLLPLARRSRSVLLGAFTAACVLETALITLQAWRGVPSHFNVETPVNAVVARTLAVGGAVLILVIITLTLAAFRRNPSVPLSLRIAIRIGFVSLLASFVVGGLMIAKGMALVAAGHPQQAYATGGSLKPIHGVTMHLILVLPALAWLLSCTDWSERRRVAIVWLAAAGYALFTGVVVAATLL